MTFIILTSLFLVSWSLSLDWGALAEFMVLLATGWLIIQLTCPKENLRDARKLYTILMLCYGSYAFLCHAYRMLCGFEAIGSMDGPGYYLPCTHELFNSESLADLVSRIAGRRRYSTGGYIFIYFVYTAKLALNVFDTDLHLAIQLALMPFASLICVVVYHLFRIFELPKDEACKWSIGFGLCSALFWLSSFIVRDMPINLAYVIVIYMIFSPMPRWRKLLFGTMLTFVAANVRMASGLGMVPLLLLAICGDSKNNQISGLGLTMCAAVTAASGLYSLIINNLSNVYKIYMDIELMDQGGMSTLSSFNSLPFGISHIVKTLYAQLHPIPAWRNMFATAANGFRTYAYNITKFPDIWVTYFRIAAMTTLIYGLCHASLRRIVAENKLLLYSFIYAVLWLCAHASTIEERRKVAIYPLLFLIAILFWRRFGVNTRKSILMFAAWMFVGVQLLHLTRLLIQYTW